jgi:2-polyprenyl-6-methoxyphenol hydroxylase-like FAD-dependent oxidoreductase
MEGVDVAFDHAAARRFDLVIGADGLHSRVRRCGRERTGYGVTSLGAMEETRQLTQLELGPLGWRWPGGKRRPQDGPGWPRASIRSSIRR